MNKRLFYYLFAVLCTVTLFTSCSDDDGPGDDGDVKKVLMENAIGTYSGELNVSLEGAPFDPITQKIFVEQESSDKVKLSLRNFSIEVGELLLSWEILKLEELCWKAMLIVLCCRRQA